MSAIQVLDLRKMSAANNYQLDWRNQVGIEQTEVLFRFNQLDAEKRPIAYIELYNRSRENILFKVKTTDPKNYVVRPN